MKRAILTRVMDDGKVTIGNFEFSSDQGKIMLVSLELPWKNNEKSISCIPKGIYKVVTTLSNRFKKDMWLLLDVPNRAGVRIHPANYSRELEGCIALGMSKADIDHDGIMDITSSKKAIEIAISNLGKEFELEIK